MPFHVPVDAVSWEPSRAVPVMAGATVASGTHGATAPVPAL